MQRSSAKNPCPSCGRHKTSHCAWVINGTEEDVILCHVGERWGPSVSTVGETIDLDGRRWALTATGKGFAGRSHVLRPDKGRSDSTFYLSPRHRKANAGVLAVAPLHGKSPAEEWQDIKFKIRAAFRVHCPSGNRVALINNLFFECKAIIVRLRRAQRHDSTLTPYTEEAIGYLRQIRYEHDHLLRMQNDPEYAYFCSDLAPTELIEPESDWAYWRQQKALPTHPWVLESKAAGEKFWYPIEGE